MNNSQSLETQIAVLGQMLGENLQQIAGLRMHIATLEAALKAQSPAASAAFTATAPSVPPEPEHA